MPQVLLVCVQEADVLFGRNPGQWKSCLCFSCVAIQRQRVQATLPPRAKWLVSAERRRAGDLGSSVCLLVFWKDIYVATFLFFFLQKFWVSSKTNTCITCKTKSMKWIKYVLHPVKAALYPSAEGKADEQDSFVLVPTPSFFGIKCRKKNQSSSSYWDNGPQLVFKYACAAPLLLVKKNGCKRGRIEPSHENNPVMDHIKTLAIPTNRAVSL